MPRFIGLLFSFVFVAAGAFVILNYQYVVDTVVANQYKPSSAVIELEKQVQFSDRGNFLFRATQAELDDAASFSRNCHKRDEKTVVLGCYIGPQKIHIYDINDPQLSGIKQVTAAHEMLHAAYDRLSGNERDRIDSLINQALPELMQTKTDLALRLEAYNNINQKERNNELHSILGSEADTLPVELENYYKQYFKNRQLITSYAASYSKVFNDIKANQEALVAELSTLSGEINELSDNYNSELARLNNEIENFNTRASSQNGFSSEAQFNAARESLLIKRNQLEAQRELINQKVDLYNEKRTQLEALNVQVEELNSKLDSTKLPSL